MPIDPRATGLTGLLGLLGQPAPQQGFGQRLQQGFANNSNLLSTLGAGLLAHRQNATRPMFGDPQSLMYASALDQERGEKKRDEEKEQARDNATRIFAIDRLGWDIPTVDGLAAAGQLGPAVMDEWKRRNTPQAPPSTDDIKEYAFAKEQGYAGTFQDWQIEMRRSGATNINLGEKLPPGYMWNDPENPRGGVAPIPGGPAEQIPGEQAARLGMAESFQDQLPGIRQDVDAGRVTGPVDNIAGRFGMGEQGRVYARIESGVDALRRSLTGAGMPAEEASDYARRYLPSPWDTAEQTQDKLTQLEQELERIGQNLTRGRGGPGDEIPIFNQQTGEFE